MPKEAPLCIKMAKTKKKREEDDLKHGTNI